MVTAERRPTFLHARAERLFDPSVSGFQALILKDAADLSFHARGVARASQEIVASELDEELAIDLALFRENPFANIESQDGIAHPSLNAKTFFSGFINVVVETGIVGGHSERKRKGEIKPSGKHQSPGDARADQELGARQAYQREMERGQPGLAWSLT
jgi:hypothetical protein